MQGNPGSLLRIQEVRKRGVAMVRTNLHKVSIHIDTALVVLGWIAFCFAVAVKDPMTKLILQTIARVLP